MIGGAIADEGHGDAGLALHFAGERHAGARPHALGDDAAGEEVHLRVVQMHVAAASAGQSGLFAEQFGHHSIEVHTPRHRDVMRPMAGAHRIVLA